ncbi:hypothetical protein EDB95_3180 [Dinghuibacter silviterrae]|uniref:Uncharacterized protein n=1 Tax=Dinghuibacter silviterrae TaxID=1539049 RepID=A0A4R8DUQ8_9BACT|nr:hypothetical protein EDB95_3180 [Dinghuibacter silviterrae]
MSERKIKHSQTLTLQGSYPRIHFKVTYEQGPEAGRMYFALRRARGIKKPDANAPGYMGLLYT